MAEWLKQEAGSCIPKGQQKPTCVDVDNSQDVKHLDGGVDGVITYTSLVSHVVMEPPCSAFWAQSAGALLTSSYCFHQQLQQPANSCSLHNYVI